MTWKSKAAIGVLSTLIAYVAINSLIRSLNPSAFVWSEEDRDESEWLASSPSWFDRKACRWLSLCGTAHLKLVRARAGDHRQQPLTPIDPGDATGDGEDDASKAWSPEERARREIPSFVLDYAPLVHLFSGEQFWPCDIADHLRHIAPTLNYTLIQSQSQHPTLRDLDELNQWEEGRNVFLTSVNNVEDRPAWLEGQKNIPDPGDGEPEAPWAHQDGRVDGGIPVESEAERMRWLDAGRLDRGSFREELRRREETHASRQGRSNAPAVLLVMDKGQGIVDAFWFYFYSFNLGNAVFNVRFGNHVGDWEHCLVRFYRGKPKALFLSAHTAGEAYSYEAVEKLGQRVRSRPPLLFFGDPLLSRPGPAANAFLQPVIYSAVGTHAMYATPAIHEYILPFGLLHDQTDRGPLWDPVQNMHAYTYVYKSDLLRASNVTPNAPTEWFYFNGHWGDKFYPLGDRRQYRFAGQYHYVNGPLGPRFKHLNRRKVCQGADTDRCIIKDSIGGKTRAKRWVGVDSGEEHGEAELQRLSRRLTGGSLGNATQLSLMDGEGV
jgi:hypothetical protein